MRFLAGARVTSPLPHDTALRAIGTAAITLGSRWSTEAWAIAIPTRPHAWGVGVGVTSDRCESGNAMPNGRRAASSRLTAVRHQRPALG
jgi:hypothetical protein